MRHDPERLAAEYLEGMAPAQRQRYEQHLLACEACWREVSLGRTGRQLAEGLREIAPAALRESIRAAVSVADADGKPVSAGVSAGKQRRRLVLSASLSVLLALAAAVGVWAPRQHSTRGTPATASQSTVTTAVASFRADSLPGIKIPDRHAPDLSALGLRLVSAATGQIDGTNVTVFAYRTDTGSRIDLYLSALPIREADEAAEVDGSERAWQRNISGVLVICGGDSHTALLVGTDIRLMRQAARQLKIT